MFKFYWISYDYKRYAYKKRVDLHSCIPHKHKLFWQLFPLAYFAVTRNANLFVEEKNQAPSQAISIYFWGKKFER